MQTLAFENSGSLAIRSCVLKQTTGFRNLQRRRSSVWFHPQLHSAISDHYWQSQTQEAGGRRDGGLKHDYRGLEEECRRCLASVQGKNKSGRFLKMWIRQKNTEWEDAFLSWQQSRLNGATVTAIFIHLVHILFQDLSFRSQSFWTPGLPWSWWVCT